MNSFGVDVWSLGVLLYIMLSGYVSIDTICFSLFMSYNYYYYFLLAAVLWCDRKRKSRENPHCQIRFQSRCLG